MEDEEDLGIEILKYLDLKKAFYSKIEIATPFILNDDSRNKRTKVANALDALAKYNLIELDGYAHSITTTNGGVMSSKYITGVKAVITPLGRKEIKPTSESTQTHQVHIHNVNNAIINSTLNQSNLDFKDSFINVPINIANTTHEKSSQYSMLENASKMLRWLLNNIWTIILG